MGRPRASFPITVPLLGSFVNTGSNSNEKSPVLNGATGRLSVPLVRKSPLRLPSYEKKKCVLSLMIGPPTVAPKLFRTVVACGRPKRLLVHVLAFTFLFWLNQKAVP